MNNRAMEFLYAAKKSFPLLHSRWGWKSKYYIDLAIDEVQELLDRLAELEATSDKCEVAILATLQPPESYTLAAEPNWSQVARLFRKLAR